MSVQTGTVAAPGGPVAPTLTFDVTDVTGTHSAVASDVQASLPAGAVARSLASSLRLPDNTPWTLRNEATGAYLDDAAPIGDQIEQTGARVTVTPKAHLG